MPGNCLAASRAAGGTGQGLPSGAWAATGKRCGGGSDLASLGSRSVALPRGQPRGRLHQLNRIAETNRPLTVHACTHSVYSMGALRQRDATSSAAALPVMAAWRRA